MAGRWARPASVELHVRPRRRDRLSGQGRRAPTTCSRRRSRPAPTNVESDDDGHEITRAWRISPPCATRWKRVRPAGECRAGLAPGQHVSLDEDAARSAAEAARRAGRQRRRAEGLCQFRDRRRRAGAADALDDPDAAIVRGWSGSIPGCAIPAGASSMSPATG